MPGVVHEARKKSRRASHHRQEWGGVSAEDKAPRMELGSWSWRNANERLEPQGPAIHRAPREQQAQPRKKKKKRSRCASVSKTSTKAMAVTELVWSGERATRATTVAVEPSEDHPKQLH
eukprot:RCo044466